MMEQMVASVISKIIKISCIESWYFQELPEGFKYPSLYFPIECITKDDTLDTYIVCYMIFMKIFQLHTYEANETAFKIIHELNRHKNKIEILNEDGATTDSYIRLSEMKMSKLDEGVVQLQLTWNTPFLFETMEPIKVQNFTFNLLKK